MSEMIWRPSATLENLRERAKILNTIRQFFAERHVLEVETPLMCQHTVTDPNVVGIPAIYQPMGTDQEIHYYLQTSPEYAMKRLLAAGIGSIYQITKAFRQGEVGSMHNPEFSMLEWYRLDYDHHDLMQEMDELLQLILKTKPAKRSTYQEIFAEHLGIDPHTADENILADCAKEKNIQLSGSLPNRDAWLDLLWTHYLEPITSLERPLFLYDFPASQASLAKVRNENPAVASRFEVYFKGVELANGFHELQDAKEQTERFQRDLAYRQEQGLPKRALDEKFIAALHHGLPPASGVALGLDRLMMLALQCKTVAEVMSFAFDRA